MVVNFVNQVGEWNPQWFRELKGRLKPRNILIAVTISLLGQLLLLMAYSSQLPVVDGKNIVQSRYCTGVGRQYTLPTCITDSFGGFVIDWSLWWKDVFSCLSVTAIFALLVVGTYMLISDLSKEEQRGTLNFLRLAPQSGRSILTGKLLGVPILLYLVGVLALPLHFVAGLSGQIPVAQVLAFYGVLAASCLLFYSAALLFGLVGTWLGGFQAWLGSGPLLLFLFVLARGGGNVVIHNPLDWLNLFNPTILVPYLLDSYGLDASYIPQPSLGGFRELQVFHLPIGASFWSLAACMVLNYALWTFWAWQGLKRCFHNPSATLLGKQQSYWLTACFEVVLLGFALNPQTNNYRSLAKGLFDNYQIVLVFNLLLFLGLIAALSPHRQAMQDWARYRHQKRFSRKGGVLADLVWGEKSPAILAVMLNLAIASASLLTWIVLWPVSEYKILAIWGLLVTVTLISVYATIAQLMLFMKTPKRAPFAATSVASLIVLPPIVFSILSMTPTENPGLWMFSAFPWASLENVSGISVFLAVIGQSLMLGLLSIQLTRQLREAGESTTKALLSGRSPLALK
jgi:hypothetical protein